MKKNRNEDDKIHDLASILFLFNYFGEIKSLGLLERLIFLLNFESLDKNGIRLFHHRIFKGTYSIISRDLSDDIRDLLLLEAIELNEKNEYSITNKGKEFFNEIKSLISQEIIESIEIIIKEFDFRSENNIFDQFKSNIIIRNKIKGDELLA